MSNTNIPKNPNDQNHCEKFTPNDWKLFCTDKIKKNDLPIDNIQIFKEGTHMIEDLNEKERSLINRVSYSYCCNDIDNMLVFKLTVETYTEADDIVSKLNNLLDSDDKLWWFVGDPRENYYI